MEEVVGKVTHFFPKIGVAVVKLDKGTLNLGNKVKISGKLGHFDQEIASMQIEHQQIEKASTGDEFGLKVDQPVKVGDQVIKIS